MKRGDIVIVAIAGDYGKPRPAVIVEADRFIDDYNATLDRLDSSLSTFRDLR
jgi:mRNA interferase MazF